jgi:hypothetical protein
MKPLFNAQNELTINTYTKQQQKYLWTEMWQEHPEHGNRSN